MNAQSFMRDSRAVCWADPDRPDVMESTCEPDITKTVSDTVGRDTWAFLRKRIRSLLAYSWFRSRRELTVAAMSERLPPR